LFIRQVIGIASLHPCCGYCFASRASEIFQPEPRHNNPTGKSAKPVQPRRKKYSA
jgi:hypothetical protein